MFLLGCQGGSAEWPGTYVGKRTVPNADSLPEELRAPYVASKLEIKEDMKFVFTVGGIPYAGTAQTSEGNLLLTVQTIVEKPISKDSKIKVLTAKWNSRGQSISVPDPTGASTKEIVLERKPDGN